MTNIYSIRPALNKTLEMRIEQFYVRYKSPHGWILNGVVKQLSDEDFEVFIKEKEVIIHCTKDKDGVVSCHLTSHGNPDWVDGICVELNKKLSLQGF